MAIIGIALSTVAMAQEETKSFVRNQRFVADPIPLNLEQLTYYADRVFTGIPIKQEERLDSKTNLPVIDYTFKIIDVIKDSGKTISNKNKVTVRQWKPISENIDFLSDTKYVIFLNPNSKIGFTSPVGLWQGQFVVEEQQIDGIKIEFVRNKLSNRGLARNLKTQKKIFIEHDKILNDYIVRSSESGEPIRYKEFVRSIRAIEKTRKKSS